MKPLSNEVMLSVQKAGVLCFWGCYQMFQWRSCSKTFFQKIQKMAIVKLKYQYFNNSTTFHINEDQLSVLNYALLRSSIMEMECGNLSEFY